MPEMPAPTTQGERPLRLANGELNISGDWAPVQMLLTDPRVGGIPREEQPARARGPGGGASAPQVEPTEAGRAASPCEVEPSSMVPSRAVGGEPRPLL